MGQEINRFTGPAGYAWESPTQPDDTLGFDWSQSNIDPVTFEQTFLGKPQELWETARIQNMGQQAALPYFQQAAGYGFQPKYGKYLLGGQTNFADWLKTPGSQAAPTADSWARAVETSRMTNPYATPGNIGLGDLAIRGRLEGPNARTNQLLMANAMLGGGMGLAGQARVRALGSLYDLYASRARGQGLGTGGFLDYISRQVPGLSPTGLPAAMGQPPVVTNPAIVSPADISMAEAGQGITQYPSDTSSVVDPNIVTPPIVNTQTFTAQDNAEALRNLTEDELNYVKNLDQELLNMGIGDRVVYPGVGGAEDRVVTRNIPTVEDTIADQPTFWDRGLDVADQDFMYKQLGVSTQPGTGAITSRSGDPFFTASSTGGAELGPTAFENLDPSKGKYSPFFRGPLGDPAGATSFDEYLAAIERGEASSKFKPWELLGITEEEYNNQVLQKNRLGGLRPPDRGRIEARGWGNEPYMTGYGTDLGQRTGAINVFDPLGPNPKVGTRVRTPFTNFLGPGSVIA